MLIRTMLMAFFVFLACSSSAFADNDAEDDKNALKLFWHPMLSANFITRLMAMRFFRQLLKVVLVLVAPMERVGYT